MPTRSRSSSKVQRTVLCWLVLGLLAAGPGLAFHNDGVAQCDACHIEHGTRDGFPVGTLLPDNYLLLAETATEVCLRCHAGSFRGVFGPDPLAPPVELGGGNFAFLAEDNLNDGPDGLTVPIPGDAAGHNVVAPAYGLFEESRWAVAPGGTYPSRDLGCTSCHDPHGNGNFRMLYGAGPIQGGIHSLSYPAPLAEGLDLFVGQEANSSHTAYLSGMSAWCANCHGFYHEGGLAPFQHPVDRPLGGSGTGASSSRYNAYAGDADPTGGSQATAYLAAVPFEDSGNLVLSTTGPSASSRVLCLSCHRAHASSSPSAGRWDFNVEYLANDGLNSFSYPIPSPYPADPLQGPLCAKCHADPVALPVAEPLPGFPGIE